MGVWLFVEFRVLGPFEVVDRGAPVQLTAPLQRTLLAALLLGRGATLSRDTLIDCLWGETPPGSAPNLLRLYASQIRRALPDGRLVGKRPGYALLIEPGELDADVFEQLIEEGRRAALAGNARLARSLLGRALALVRGSSLADFATEPFAAHEAQRLDELRLECLEERLAADLELGRHDEILPELQSQVSEHPLRERLRAQLMLALYRCGRQAEALASYRDGRTILVEELGLEPSAELRRLEQRILDQDPTLLPATAPPGPVASVPQPRTATVGRDDELDRIRREVLAPRTRLVTLVGPGGIGKTRLATEVARSAAPELADGAVLVDLAPLADPRQLLAAIGRTLGLHESGTASWLELLAVQLESRELLLVLDNLEHLVDGIAPLAELLDRTPHVTVLATSRRPLRLSAEQVVEVRPLPHAASLTLLGERAIASGATVDPESEELARVTERLEGLPLAIELAAPWLRTVRPAVLVQMLDSRLDVLRAGSRDAASRHQTMRSAIDWGFELLPPAAQRLLGRLSLFSGGFTSEAMVAVSGAEAGIDDLAVLVDASIVHSAGARYHLLEVIREYANDLPSADAEGRTLHAEYFTALAETAEAQLAGVEQGAWLERLELEHDNLRAALDWLAASPAAQTELRLAAALGRFWYIRGYLTEGLARIAHAAERSGGGDAPPLAKALRTASALGLLRGDYAAARSAAERALTLYRESGDPAGIVRSLSNLGAILHALGELDDAAETLDECIGAAEALGDERLIALARNNRGDVALSQGDLDNAGRQFEASLELLRAIDDSTNVARSLYNLGAVALEQGDDAGAATLFRESLGLATGLDDDEDAAWSAIGLAALCSRGGRAHDAATLLGFASASIAAIGATMKPFEQRLFDRTRDLVVELLAPGELDQAFERGGRLTPAEILRLEADSTTPAAEPVRSPS